MLVPCNHESRFNLFGLINQQCTTYMFSGGSGMVGALRQTTWWGPLRRSAQKKMGEKRRF